MPFLDHAEVLGALGPGQLEAEHVGDVSACHLVMPLAPARETARQISWIARQVIDLPAPGTARRR